MMKSLYESLLDDFEEIGSRQDKTIRAEILPNSWFRLGADGKTIIFEPETTNAPVFRDTVPGITWCTYPKNNEYFVNDISVCKDIGLKFQPLNFIVDQRVGQDKDWLKYFDCEYVINFAMTTERGTTPDIDLSMIKFPIKGTISISGFADGIKSLKPYPHPVEIVRINREPITPSVVSGWKCKHLVIGGINNVVFRITKDRNYYPGVAKEESDQIMIEWVDEILKNNPDVENVYLGQCTNHEDNRRVVTKGRGANRKCVKLVRVPRAKWNALIFNDVAPELRNLANEVEGWRWKHEDLFECECAPATAGAATPGNTLGMGNPMAPSGGTPGTEPVIPKHPKNKKKRNPLKESLLDDFDTIADFQQLEMLLSTPDFSKKHFNKIKKMFQKAGGGVEYDHAKDKNNDNTYYIGLLIGGWYDKEMIISKPAEKLSLVRIYWKYGYIADKGGFGQLTPTVWAIEKLSSVYKFKDCCQFKKSATPISIPDVYLPYFKRLMNESPEFHSTEWRAQNDSRKKW